jgi:hypothetical protein
MISENIRRFENNHHFESTSAAFARLHVNHINLRIRMVQETTSETSEIVFPRSVDGGVLVKVWMREGNLNRARYNILRSIAKRDIFLVFLL